MTYAPADRMKMQLRLEEALTDKAVVQTKFEMAADLLHDIGNAIVGFGTYLTRIRYSMEQNKNGNLSLLADFFAERQSAIGPVIGDAKAVAVVNMLRNMAESDQIAGTEIRKSVEDQLHIIGHIQEMLNLHRQYAAGQDSCQTRPVNLHSVVSDCLSMLFAAIDKRQITVRVENTSESPIVQGDMTRLLQVVMNLLKNSMESIDRNATDKSILIRLSEMDDFLILEIKDSGSGFDSETETLLFGRGFTTKSSGTGLGLHNCRTIVESHAGSLSLTSEGLGKGALATVKFKM